MISEHYRAFIYEAFIAPIRSVLIVDDDYPTYDDILGDTQPENKSRVTMGRRKAWHDEPKRIKHVISKFREHIPPLLVDIHDGSNISVEGEITVAKHLHQSDLLVLDYQLEPDGQNDGMRAIEILRSLISNDHLNLVIIYTNKEIDSVFDEVRWGLINPIINTLSKSKIRKAEQLIDAGEDEFDGFRQRISESIASAQYFHFRLHQPNYQKAMTEGQQPYSTFISECDRVKWDEDKQNLVLQYLLRKVEQKNRIGTGNIPGADNLSWSFDSIKWIKSDSVFVAFAEKADDNDLLSDLQTALVDWNPEPSRLLLTKLRAEMDEHGIAVQSKALSNHHALAYWYYRLLSAGDELERRWRIAESVSRHSDRLISRILPGVECFIARLAEVERKAFNDDIKRKRICKEHFDIDLADDRSKKQAALQHNAFVCSMEPKGWHLTTGHIFSIKDEYWLCLSPACDMVPSQISKWRCDAIGDQLLPFIAIRLQPIQDMTRKHWDRIHSNRYVFLLLNGKVSCLSFNAPLSENSAPERDLLYAGKRGKFTVSDGNFHFSVYRVEQKRCKQKDVSLIFENHDAMVVSQLQYEYALNLTQKLGISLTRIGLDFVDGRV